MNIDSLGPETVDDLFQQGLLHNVADLYELTLVQLAGGQSTRQRSAQRILDGITASRSVPFERVLFALGIRFVGEIAAKALARYFKTFEALAQATEEELQQVNGIGTVIAQSLCAWMRNEENQRLIARLRAHGLEFALAESQLQAQSNRLAGQTIVISGVFTRHSRDEYKALIEQHGGKNTGSISAKTSYLLAGTGIGPAKLEKAQKLGLPILSEDEFLRLIGKGQ